MKSEDIKAGDTVAHIYDSAAKIVVTSIGGRFIYGTENGRDHVYLVGELVKISRSR